MRVFGLNIPKVIQQHSLKELSREAKQRLHVLGWYEAHGRNARLTYLHFCLSPDTFYRWKRRYDSHRLLTLESRSHRPLRVRQPTWSPELVQAVLQLRTENPRWGKEKLTQLLNREDRTVSVSMVGRMLTYLKSTGQLRETLAPDVGVVRRSYKRPYAVRKPKENQPAQPGDLVQLDTLGLRPLPGVVLKQFPSRDVVSRWDVLGVGTQATAAAATRFLDDLQARMPFPVLAIQIDGGSEWVARFEQSCQARGIRLFVLPPHSPKLNGSVERANRHPHRGVLGVL
jgi:transposase